MKNILFITLIALVASVSCRKADLSRTDDGNVSKPVVIQTKQGSVAATEFTLNASNKDKWVSFSFKEKKVLDINDLKTNNTWDIAACRYNMKTNSGISGNAKGAAVITVFSSFDEAMDFKFDNSQLDFQVDKDILRPGVFGTQDNVAMNPAFAEAFKPNKAHANNPGGVNGTGPAPLIRSDKVFLVKCADGNTYAAVKFLGYENKVGVTGFITFQYIYPFVIKLTDGRTLGDSKQPVADKPANN